MGIWYIYRETQVLGGEIIAAKNGDFFCVDEISIERERHVSGYRAFWEAM